MKKNRYTPFLLFGVSAAVISLWFFQSNSGPHGGMVKPADEYTIEMKNVYTEFNTWLLGKDLKPVSNNGIECEVNFLFADSTSMDVKLTPSGEDGFATKTGVPGFTSCRITFDLPGKKVSARFENSGTIVKR
jgi:hypothetical protein